MNRKKLSRLTRQISIALSRASNFCAASAAANRLQYLQRPDLGRRLSPETRAGLARLRGARTSHPDAVAREVRKVLASIPQP